MFRGSSFHTMDNKGRVSIPMRFREILQERQERQLILTNWDGYILAYPHNEWVKLEAKLAELKTFNKNNRNFKRFLLSGVEECPLDRQGRILIPQSLREYAKLGREIAIVGQVQNFEIWDRERYEANRKQLEESIDESMFDELLI